MNQMTSKRRTNPRYKAFMLMRKRIHVSTRLIVESAGDGKERLSCKTCGWTHVQNVGGMTDEILAQSNKALIEKLVRYRGDGGIWGECDACTKRARDERYPMADVPRYL